MQFWQLVPLHLFHLDIDAFAVIRDEEADTLRLPVNGRGDSLRVDKYASCLGVQP